tara:strand:- start:969 stop:1268 length:300 start_codon:yes stop_codon:yes gene_type:complete
LSEGLFKENFAEYLITNLFDIFLFISNNKAFMSEKEIQNQTLNLLMKELRKLEYFSVTTSSKMISLALCIMSEKLGTSIESISDTEEMHTSIKSMIFKH